MERLPTPQESGEIVKIMQGITAAAAEERNVDDGTARLIASQLHGGQFSALYSLASTGAVDYDGIRHELLVDYERADPQTRLLYDHIGTYAVEHAGRPVVEGWHELTADQEKQEDDPEQLPMVWVGDLSAYNNGDLRGKWVDAAREPVDLQADINALLDSSPYPGAEEWAFFDHQGFFGIDISENESLDNVSRLACDLAEHGEEFAAYLQLLGGINYLNRAEDQFEDAWAGEYPSEEEAAHEMLDDGGVFDAVERAKAEVPEGLADFIVVDTDAYVDAQPDVHFVRTTHGVYVFREI